MLITEKVKIRVTSHKFKYYKDKGYNFNCNDYIEVAIEDLSEGSHTDVEVKCDYCGKIIIKEYKTYLIQNKKHAIQKDCCKECQWKKSEESTLVKYGVSNISQLEHIKNKKEETTLKNYNVTNPAKSSIVLDKMKNTTIERYGVDNVMYVESISEQQHIKRSKTMYSKGNTPCSMPQSYIHYLIGGELNFPVHTSALDIAFVEDKIYIEYDGSGHKMNVYCGKVSEEEYANKERKRRYALRNDSWKEIRIISVMDKLPSDEIILEMIQYAFEYFKSGHTWIHFDIDNKIVITSQYKKEYDYGKVKRLTDKQKENIKAS